MMARAYVLMNCDLGSEKNVIDVLKQIEFVKEVHGTLGMYDLVTKIESETQEKIRQTVTDIIRKKNQIHSTMTLMCVEGDEIFTPNPDKLTGAMLGQNTSQAYVVIHCDRGEEYNILKNLSHIPEVKEADIVFGLYDVICKVESSTYKELEELIIKGIRNLGHVRTTMTLNVITEQEN